MTTKPSCAGFSPVENYVVEAVSTGQQALLRLRDSPWDLVLLDWTLPDFSGVEVCRRLRASELTIPVLMLTARDAVAERVQALDAGADDYLTKPFSIEELLARVRARLRRSGSSNINETVLSFADLRVNTASHEVSRGGEDIKLTVREYNLLLALLRDPSRVQERQALLHNVWGEHFVGDASLLDVYIRYLRKKIERSGWPTLIQTVRGVGFILREGDPKS